MREDRRPGATGRCGAESRRRGVMAARSMGAAAGLVEVREAVVLS